MWVAVPQRLIEKQSNATIGFVERGGTSAKQKERRARGGGVDSPWRWRRLRILKTALQMVFECSLHAITDTHTQTHRCGAPTMSQSSQSHTHTHTHAQTDRQRHKQALCDLFFPLLLPCCSFGFGVKLGWGVVCFCFRIPALLHFLLRMSVMLVDRMARCTT